MTTPQQGDSNNPGTEAPWTGYYHDKYAYGPVPKLEDAAALTSGDDIIAWNNEPPVAYPPDTYERDLMNAVPVKVVDVAEKVRRIKHVISTASIPPGECREILGKDPTRIRAKLVETGGTTDGYLLTDSGSNSALGFPVNSLDVIESEETLYVYNNGAVNNIVVCVYAEYVRSDASRQERFYGSIQDGKRR